MLLGPAAPDVAGAPSALLCCEVDAMVDDDPASALAAIALESLPLAVASEIAFKCRRV